MRISAIMAMWMCAVFAVLCYSVAAGGYFALDTVTDAAEREASGGYIGFWAFLGTVAVVFGVLSWMIKEGKLGKFEE